MVFICKCLKHRTSETVSLHTEYKKMSITTTQIHIMTKDLDLFLVEVHRKMSENTIIF